MRAGGDGTLRIVFALNESWVAAAQILLKPLTSSLGQQICIGVEL